MTWRKLIIVAMIFQMYPADQVITFGGGDASFKTSQVFIDVCRHLLSSYLYPVYHKNVEKFNALFTKYLSGKYQEDIYRDTVNAFKEAANSSDPEVKAVAYYMIGILQLASPDATPKTLMSDYEKAVMLFKKASATDPKGNAGVLAHYLIENRSFFSEGKIYLDKIDPIIAELNKMYEVEKDTFNKFRYMLQIGLINMMATHIKEAIASFDKSLVYFDQLPEEIRKKDPYEHAVAVFCLGLIYFNGWGVPKDLKKARQYLEIGEKLTTRKDFIAVLLAAITFELEYDNTFEVTHSSKVLNWIKQQQVDVMAHMLAKRLITQFNVFQLAGDVPWVVI